MPTVSMPGLAFGIGNALPACEQPRLLTEPKEMRTQHSSMTRPRRLLVAQTHEPPGLGWDIETFLSPTGAIICRARSCREAICRVEEGVSAAVLLEEAGPSSTPDVFALLRIIRSLDAVLPCWLVTRVADRRCVQRAFELRVQSIIEYPTGVGELLAGLQRVLRDPALEN